MACSIGPQPSRKKFVIVSGCAVFGLALILAMIWAFFYMVFSPSLWKTKIGEAEIDGIGRMCVGHAHDGDISYNYFVRIEGGHTEYSDWTYFGWDLAPSADGCRSASSLDGRFTCIYSAHVIHPWPQLGIEAMPLMVIYDRKSGIIWPTEKSDKEFTSFWLSAWRTIRLSNPELPKAPD